MQTNPIDDIYARIQQIAGRIREIESLGRRPPGQAQQQADSTQAKNTGSASSATGSTEFQKLLQDGLANGQTDSTGLAGSGLSGVESLLGLGSSDTGATGSADNTARLKEYQEALLQAIKDLQAQNKKSGTSK